jgi:hypothetical protein
LDIELNEEEEKKHNNSILSMNQYSFKLLID